MVILGIKIIFVKPKALLALCLWEVWAYVRKEEC